MLVRVQLTVGKGLSGCKCEPLPKYTVDGVSGLTPTKIGLTFTKSMLLLSNISSKDGRVSSK